MPRYIDADALKDVIQQHDYPLSDKLNSIGNGMFTLGIFQAIDQMPTVSPDEVRGGGCEVCNYDKPLPQEGLSHEFYIHGGAIYHYDSELGWEGEDIAFCPFCGKRLRMKGADDGTTD